MQNKINKIKHTGVYVLVVDDYLYKTGDIFGEWVFLPMDSPAISKYDDTYEETLAYLKSASKNGKPDLEEMWKFLQSTYSPELKNSVSPSTGNSAPSEESTDDVEENSETEETSSTVPEQKISHYDSNDLEFLAD